MLTKFEVKNFKNFKENFVLDFTKTRNYNFNPECVKDGIVNKAIIYGQNGIGKSNLGFAIFDIVSHLTDKNKSAESYNHYINAENSDKIVEFTYSFKFSGNSVTYHYTKKSFEELIIEELKINGKTCVSIDRSKSENAFIDLSGAETLNRDPNSIKISVVKYIASNAVLADNPLNSVFISFIKFVNKMLFCQSLKGHKYIGYSIGLHHISEEIVSNKNVEDFERFLNTAGIKCKLKEKETNGQKSIAFVFGEQLIDFFQIASTGTIALAGFYYWLQSLRIENEISFVYFDEFDAYYHHELSEIIVKEIKKGNYQTVLTTHNTTIMSNDLLRPDCYFIMDKKGIKPLSELTNKELRLAHNIEKMYIAGDFNE